jgi:hypothetical protein
MNAWQIAALRAGIGGFVLGAAGFFAIWAQSDDVKLLITSFMVPFWGTIATRGAAEGWWDTAKK